MTAISVILRVIACIWCASLFFPYIGNICLLFRFKELNKDILFLWIWWTVEIVFNLLWIFNRRYNASLCLATITLCGYSIFRALYPCLRSRWDRKNWHIFSNDMQISYWNFARALLLGGFLIFG